MNKYFFLVIFLFFSIIGVAQQLLINKPIHEDELRASVVNIQQFKLANGLTVYLNSDMNMTDVMGAVVVRGGANHDPKDADGTAHYFEHMMFKGSSKLGTVNYKEERVYLDSIKRAYDLLALSKGDDVFRKGILKNIDRLSQEASKYAIPNEFNMVLASIGGTQINAYTTYENIVYHNHFPAESMLPWIALQVDRFQEPVFRLFQSELETVYEEKNMAMDNSFRNIYQELYKGFYPNSVYGKQTVLGSVESLKTPSISKMETYFKDYYVANNMALILVGNFDEVETRNMLEDNFGAWRDGESLETEPALEEAFEGRVVIKKKLSPVPMGILGYRTVEKGNKDALVLEVINQLLSNDESTGLLDALTNKGDLMYATAISDNHYDIGANFIVFVPKPFVQSLKGGEKKVREQLEKLKNGEFDTKLLNAILVNKRKEFLTSIESSDTRTRLIIDAFMSNKKVQEVFDVESELKHINKERIQLIAQKYFGDNYLAFLSKMGFPKKTKLEKPSITPLKPVNTDSNSDFANKILSMSSSSLTPMFIDFNTDVQSKDLFSNLHLYYTHNPMNDVYSVEFKIGIGTYKNNELELVADYLNRVGTERKKFKPFRTDLQAIGTSITARVDMNYFYIDMTGFESSLPTDLQALKKLLTETEVNEVVLKKVIKDYSMEYKFIKSDIGMQSKMLTAYSLYESNSPYLMRMSAKEMKKQKVDDVLAAIKQLLRYETEIHYVGQVQFQEVISLINETAIFTPGLYRSDSPIYLELPKLSTDRLYFMNNKKAVQSHIRISIPSKSADIADRNYVTAYNKYFGLGMSSVVFREIREYRSLAYGVYAYMDMPFNFSNDAHFTASMTTQGDKTNESIKVFMDLIENMQIQGNAVEGLQRSLTNSFNSKTPSFRKKSLLVSYWIRQGYYTDPRNEQFELYKKLTADDIMHFYRAFVPGRKSCITIVGDEKRFDLDSLKQNKEYKKLKLKDIYLK